VHNAAVWPGTGSGPDIAAAERAEGWHNFPMFLDPLVHGRYPPALEPRLRPFLPVGYENDMPALQVPPDFVGINYYHGYYVRDTSDNWLGFVEVDGPEAPRTKMNWAVRPEGLHRVLTRCTSGTTCRRSSLRRTAPLTKTAWSVALSMMRTARLTQVAYCRRPSGQARGSAR